MNTMFVLAKYGAILFSAFRIIGEGAIARKLCSKSKYADEIGRKTSHVLIGIVLYSLAYWAFRNTIHIVILPIIGIVVSIALDKMGMLNAIHRNDGHDNMKATPLYFTGMLIVGALSLYNPIFSLPGLLGVDVLAISDTCAAFAGKIFGKHKICKGKKSVEGFLAFVASAIITIFIVSRPFSIDISFGSIVLAALLSGIAELYSGDYDNITIPVVVCVTLGMFLCA